MAKRASVSLVLFKVRHFELDRDLDVGLKAQLSSTLTKEVFTPQSLQFLELRKELKTLGGNDLFGKSATEL